MNSRDAHSEKEQMVTIRESHFHWLNHEVVRISNLAREYWDRGDRLQKEVDRLTKELDNKNEPTT